MLSKILFLFTLFYLWTCDARYQPTWESLDARPLPSWYDQSKFGIFIHWGVFSVPSYGCKDHAGEWYWWYLDGEKAPCIVSFHNKTYGPTFQYEDFAPMFRADLFDANEWASLFKQSGAKYVVLTSKHHDGFCNWPSSQAWNWNSVDNGPHQDNVGLITTAVRNAGLRMGLYHSLMEWFNPLYLQDKSNNGTTQTYVDQILWPQLKDIVTKYKPEIVWSDGDWEMPDTYWKSKEFLAWLYNDSPVKDTVLTNDRWGQYDNCKHGGYWTCTDRYNPGKLLGHKWENCLTIDKGSWGYNRNTNIDGYLSMDDLISQFASTVACGGNLLLNVGPTLDGKIPPVYQERLVQIGEWLSVNGESIYSTTPWRSQNDTISNVWYTTTRLNNPVYAIMLKWPENNQIVLTQPIASPNQSTVQMLGMNGSLEWKSDGDGKMIVQLPDVPVSMLPCKWAWVLKLQNVK